MIDARLRTQAPARWRAAISLALVFWSAAPLLPAQKAPVIPSPQGLRRFVASSMAELKVPGLAVAVARTATSSTPKASAGATWEDAPRHAAHAASASARAPRRSPPPTIGILVDEKQARLGHARPQNLPSFRLPDPVASERLHPPRPASATAPACPATTWSGITDTVHSPRAVSIGCDTSGYPRFIRQRYQYNNLMVHGRRRDSRARRRLRLGGLIRRRIADPLGMAERISRPMSTRKRPTSPAPTPWSRAKSRNSLSIMPMRWARPDRSTPPSWTCPAGSWPT